MKLINLPDTIKYKIIDKLISFSNEKKQIVINYFEDNELILKEKDIELKETTLNILKKEFEEDFNFKENFKKYFNEEIS